MTHLSKTSYLEKLYLEEKNFSKEKNWRRANPVAPIWKRNPNSRHEIMESNLDDLRTDINNLGSDSKIFRQLLNDYEWSLKIFGLGQTLGPKLGNGQEVYFMGDPKF